MWTRGEEELLDTAANEAIARQLKRSVNSVKLHRRLLGIESVAPKNVPTGAEAGR